MEVVYLSNIVPSSTLQDTVYTIGNFDGIHKGHQELLNVTKIIAQNLNSNWGVIIFIPNTKLFFSSLHKVLTTLEQQLQKFNYLKVPKVVVIDFSKVYNLNSYEFIYQYLVKCLKANALVVGENFKLGKDLFNFGNNVIIKSNSHLNKHEFQDNVNLNFCGILDFANSYAKKYIYYNSFLNLQVYSTGIKTMNSNVISSTLIKNLLKSGNIKEVNKLLGHNFTIKSKVIHGKKLGRTLGFPTINMLIPQYETLKYGIYATKTHLPNKIIKSSVSNFGVRPTINNSSKEEILETFIFDYNGDLYNQEIDIEFVDYIREEKKFNNLEELIENIKQDTIKARLIHEEYKETV